MPFSLLRLVVSEIRPVVKSRKLRSSEHIARMGHTRNAHRILVEKRFGKLPVIRLRKGWNIAYFDDCETSSCSEGVNYFDGLKRHG